MLPRHAMPLLPMLMMPYVAATWRATIDMLLLMIFFFSLMPLLRYADTGAAAAPRYDVITLRAFSRIILMLRAALICAVHPV